MSAIVKQLLAQSGESVEWPDDTRFREAWLNRPAYGPLNNPRLVCILSRLNQTFMSSKAEPVEFSTQPTVEHILPEDWRDHWPLPDGNTGLDVLEELMVAEDDPRAVATRRRDTAKQTVGNLTILSSALNSAQSNLSWASKRPELMNHSLLPINQPLFALDKWDETTIRDRGDDLFGRALTIWPRASL